MQQMPCFSFISALLRHSMIISFLLCNHFMLVRVTVDPGPIPETLAWEEYTLIMQTHLYTQSHLGHISNHLVTFFKMETQEHGGNPHGHWDNMWNYTQQPKLRGPRSCDVSTLPTAPPCLSETYEIDSYLHFAKTVLHSFNQCQFKILKNGKRNFHFIFQILRSMNSKLFLIFYFPFFILNKMGHAFESNFFHTWRSLAQGDMRNS